MCAELTRRGLFRLLAGAAIAPQTKYFFAPIGGWHSDYILRPDTSVRYFSYHNLFKDPPHNAKLPVVHMRMYQKVMLEEALRNYVRRGEV